MSDKDPRHTYFSFDCLSSLDKVLYRHNNSLLDKPIVFTTQVKLNKILIKVLEQSMPRTLNLFIRLSTLTIN